MAPPLTLSAVRGSPRVGYRLTSSLALRPRPGADHEAVEGVFRNLPPQILVVAECLHRIQNLLVIGVGSRRFGINLVRRLQACLHHRLRERTQLRAGRDETLERGRIASVISGGFLDVGQTGSRSDDGLIGLWQLVPFR